MVPTLTIDSSNTVNNGGIINASGQDTATAIQINASEAREVKESEGGHEWKYPEDRTKAIMAVINPKQLESGTLSTDHPRHFNQNTPIVFER